MCRNCRRPQQQLQQQHDTLVAAAHKNKNKELKKLKKLCPKQESRRRSCSRRQLPQSLETQSEERFLSRRGQSLFQWWLGMAQGQAVKMFQLICGHGESMAKNPSKAPLTQEDTIGAAVAKVVWPESKWSAAIMTHPC